MKRASGGQYAYAASKAATFQMTKVLATELLETGIRCNQIAPGKSDESLGSRVLMMVVLIGRRRYLPFGHDGQRCRGRSKV
jgi:NAD(P)-dependent dehydrogenase (short-subunit alcohol dehydrogenase family)